MSFNPFASIQIGVSDTTQLNALISAANAFFTGLGQGGSAAASGTLTLGTSLADIANCTKTVTVSGANAFAVVTGAFDMSKTAVAATAVGVLVVDGAAQAAQAIFSDSGNTITDRQTVCETWTIPLTAGSHTLKLQASRSPGAGAVAANATNTVITVTVFDIP